MTLRQNTNFDLSTIKVKTQHLKQMLGEKSLSFEIIYFEMRRFKKGKEMLCSWKVLDGFTQVRKYYQDFRASEGVLWRP